MKNYLCFLNLKAASMGVVLFLGLSGPAAQAVDWSGVEGKQITLFYPGQASWEWVLTKADHSGADKFKQGKNCIGCHIGEEKDIGAKIVSGKKLEPHPIAGKRGSINVNVKVAHDAERFYVRMEWEDGPTLEGVNMDADHAIKATMMFDDGNVKEATRAGCWGTCHDDAIDMASAAAGKDITKYLVASRSKVTRQGGGENYKADADLQQLLAQGTFLEYWQARANPGAEAVAVDGYILDKRHKNDTPAVSASAELKDGKWVVELSRKLVVGDPHHKAIVAGKVYAVGFAIHESHTAHRFHNISFEHTFTLDQGEADLIAVKR